MVYISLEKTALEKSIPEANKEAISEMGEDGEDCCIWYLDDQETRIDEISEDGTLEVSSESELGYISFSIKLTEEDIITLTELLIKRLNKFRAVMQSLK